MGTGYSAEKQGFSVSLIARSGHVADMRTLLHHLANNDALRPRRDYFLCSSVPSVSILGFKVCVCVCACVCVCLLIILNPVTIPQMTEQVWVNNRQIY